MKAHTAPSISHIRRRAQRNGKEYFYDYYRIILYGRQRVYHTREEAERALRASGIVQITSGDDGAKLLTRYSDELIPAIHALLHHGIDPLVMVKHAMALVAEREGKRTPTLYEVGLAFLNEMKTSGRLHPATLRGYRCALEHFTDDHLDTPVASLVPDTIAEHFRTLAQAMNPVTFNTEVRRLKTFCRWASRRGYALSEVLFSGVDNLPVQAEEPTFISVPDAQRLFEAIVKTDDPRLLLFSALAFFAGIRSCEILSLEEEAIHLNCEEPYIRVSRVKGASHGRRGRMVELMPNAVQWLHRAFAIADRKGIRPMPTVSTMKRLTRLFKAIGMEKHNNVARHSFITYHVARFGNEFKTVTLCGTSREMAAMHYKGLAEKSEAMAYFNILPPQEGIV